MVQRQGVGAGKRFLAEGILSAKYEGLVAAGPRHDLLGGHSTVGPDVARCDSLSPVAEDVALIERLFVSLIVLLNSWKEARIVLTAKILTTPITRTTIPDEITIRQNARPSDSWLVASLFRFPRIETPRITIVTPRVTKLASCPIRGQLRAKYPRKMGSSDTIRKTMGLVC